MSNRDGGFVIDYERLGEVSERAYRAYVEGRGIFRHKEIFLPQWALPQDFEYDPQRTETRCPIQAGDYLWLLASLERKSLTRQNIKNGLGVWGDEGKRWIFSPEVVVERATEDVERATEEIGEFITENFQYPMQYFSNNFLHNNRIIVDEFGGHARNIINNQTVEESRRRLMEFKGIGTGIANLFIIYCTDRGIAHVQDSEEIRIKIDIHKARISANTDAITSVSNGRIRRDRLVHPLEESYLEICKENGFSGGTLDSALWLIGSQICARRDFGRCVSLCPLETMCTSCVREDSSTVELILYDQNKRVEMRRDSKVQLYFGNRLDDSLELF